MSEVVLMSALDYIVRADENGRPHTGLVFSHDGTLYVMYLGLLPYKTSVFAKSEGTGRNVAHDLLTCSGN